MLGLLSSHGRHKSCEQRVSSLLQTLGHSSWQTLSRRGLTGNLTKTNACRQFHHGPRAEDEYSNDQVRQNLLAMQDAPSERRSGKSAWPLGLNQTNGAPWLLSQHPSWITTGSQIFGATEATLGSLLARFWHRAVLQGCRLPQHGKEEMGSRGGP